MESEPETKVLPRGNADVAAPPPTPHGETSGPPLQRIGRYEVVQRIGHGGMATVYLGRATGSAGFERTVAIKVIHPHLAAEPEFVEMFLDEARIAAKIHSPHVAGILDLGEDAGFYYMVLEFIDGETLSALIRQLRPGDERLPLAVALQILADACEGLTAVHGLRDPEGRLYGLVHRDMSPQNLIVNFDGWTKIVDFGLVKATGLRNSSHTGHLRGKLAYMAPEQARGRSLSASTDLFALGVIFWEMLTGRRLFAGDSDVETLDRVTRCEVPPLRELRPDLPPGVEVVLRRALAPDPERRYASAEAMLSDIRALLRECADTSEPRRALGSIMQHHFGEQAKYRWAALRGAARAEDRARARLAPVPVSGPAPAARSLDDETRREGVAVAGEEATPDERVVSTSRPIAARAATESASVVAPVSRPWGLWLALPLVGAGVAAILLIFVFPRGSGPQPVKLPTPAPAEAASPPQTPHPRTVVWNFETEPDGATVAIQGATPAVMSELAPQLAGQVTPIRLVVPYDEETRLSVLFSKTGYRASRRSLIPMNNENFNVALQAEPLPPVEPPPPLVTKKKTTKTPERNVATTTGDTKADTSGELKDEPKFDTQPGKGGG